MRAQQFAKAMTVLVAVFGSFPARADVPVRIVSSQQQLTQGVEIGVFRRGEEEEADFLKIKTTATFDRRGGCELQLPTGRYRFEALAAKEGSLLCIRSEELEISDKPVTVRLPKAIQGRVTCQYQGQLLQIRQMAIRSLGGRSEARFQSSHRLKATKLYASPHEKLNLSFVGFDNDALVAGSACTEAEKKIEIVAGGDGWHLAKLRLHEESKPLALARATLIFPIGEEVIPVNENTTIVSNRALLRLRYELRDKKGHRLVTQNAFLDLSSGEDFMIGGPLRQSTWAVVLSRDSGEKSLYHGASLLDSEGCEVDQKESRIGWQATLRMKDGGELPKNPLEPEAIEALGKPSETLAYQLQWEWGSQHATQAAPAPLQKIHTDIFVLHVPPPWRRQMFTYLGYVELIRTILIEKTGRGGPEQIDVRWRTNTHNAKARVGGKHAWISLPFEGLRKAGDPYTGPWFLIHELIHNFGYHHGEEMERLKDESDFVLTGSRWREEFEPQAQSPLAALIGNSAIFMDE